MSELLHQLLPVAAGAQVSFVESPDVLHDFLSLHALPQRHILGDVGGNLRYVVGLSIQPLLEAKIGENGVNRKMKEHTHTKKTQIQLTSSECWQFSFPRPLCLFSHLSRT